VLIAVVPIYEWFGVKAFLVSSGVQMVSGVVWSANGKWSGVECKW
jgi:hypothetical protein